jgi:glucan phosphoethanolaminetransferase (alkaline phosphatase superfamily)
MAISSHRYRFLWFFILPVMLLSPNIYLATTGLEYVSGSITKKVALLTFSALLFLLPLLVVKTRLYLFIMSPLVLLIPLEITHVNLYGTSSSIGGTGALIGTNISESVEFIDGFELLIYSGPALFVIFLWIVIAKIKKDFMFTKRVKKNLFYISMIFFSLIFTRDVFFAPENNFGMAAGGFTNRFYKTYPIGALFKLITASQYKARELYHSSALKKFQFNAAKKDNPAYREVYLLIIGETARYKSWGINGYHRNTSPNLSNNSDIISYIDVSSAATQTRTALPILFTRASTDSLDLMYKEKSFLSAFRECNFKTYWISNQGRFSSINENEADKMIFLKSNIVLETKYDGDMLPVLSEILNGNERKLCIVLHTLGSHHKYSHRYPDNFDLFKPSLKEKEIPCSPGAKDVYTNSYDNSILYTDFFISSVINMASKTDSISCVLYISDHGENLYDDDRNLRGHGSPQPSKYETHIPLFLWLSEHFRNVYPDKYLTLQMNKDKGISLENIFFSILDIANITYDGEDLTRSIASHDLKTYKREVLTVNNDRIPFDDLF